MRENESVLTRLVDSRGEKGGAYRGLQVRDSREREKKKELKEIMVEGDEEKVKEIVNIRKRNRKEKEETIMLNGKKKTEREKRKEIG